MGAAEKLQLDYGACEKMLFWIFSAEELGGNNVLADYIQAKPKDFIPTLWRRSKKETTHAVATRNSAGSSIPMDEIDWYKTSYVRAVSALPEPYPDMLRGRFHPNPTISEKFSVVHPVLKTYRKRETIMLAKDMIDHIYSPKMVRDEKRNRLRPQKVFERYGYTYDEWEDMDARKAWDRLRRRIREHMRPAIDAWVIECRKRDLEI